jgi:MoxR-like ATPase
MVIATQNPLEYHGTFPLPESQLDRFMLHLRLGYPSPEYEKQALLGHADFEDIDRLGPVVESADILRMQREADAVDVEKDILDYLLAIVTETRRSERIRLGASTRGAQYLLKMAKACAYYGGRDFVTPEDVKEVAPFVLGHRLMLKGQVHISDAARVVADILDRVPVPA